ncbi:hypothetical protein V1264_005471 [Littorina saxatilis]|uniref:Uncharacterized protein n=2 Tax=Littorina saxatilis TaxID=31220 RepID=A0AAN9G5H7_9CAEN
MPPLAELERLLAVNVDFPASFYQLPQVRNGAEVTTLSKFEDSNPNMTNIQHSNIGLAGTQCQTSGPSFDPCPMTWKFNYDQNRIPQTTVEGECQACSSCSQLVSGASNLGCEPVKHYTKVLRRKRNCHPETNNYVYVEVWEPFIVGCSCRTASRAASDPDDTHNPPQ